MALSKCDECGGLVGKSAKVCPNCGAKIKKKAGLLGWLLVIFVVAPAAWQLGKYIDSEEFEQDADQVVERLSAPAATSSRPTRDQCREYSEYAGEVMRSRHGDIPMHEIPTDGNRILEGLVAEAYSQRRLYTPDRINQSVSDFQSMVYRTCIDQ